MSHHTTDATAAAPGDGARTPLDERLASSRPQLIAYRCVGLALFAGVLYVAFAYDTDTNTWNFSLNHTLWWVVAAISAMVAFFVWEVVTIRRPRPSFPWLSLLRGHERREAWDDIRTGRLSDRQPLRDIEMRWAAAMRARGATSRSLVIVWCVLIVVMAFTSGWRALIWAPILVMQLGSWWASPRAERLLASAGL